MGQIHIGKSTFQPTPTFHLTTLFTLIVFVMVGVLLFLSSFVPFLIINYLFLSFFTFVIVCLYGRNTLQQKSWCYYYDYLVRLLFRSSFRLFLASFSFFPLSTLFYIMRLIMLPTILIIIHDY